MKVLIVQLRQLGDILLTTPCLREIKREVPGAQLSFLSHRMGRLILDDHPFLDQHYVYPENDWRAEWRMARDLRRERFDIVIDFMNNPRSGLYTLSTGATTRVGFRSARRWSYNRLMPRPKGESYIVRDKFTLMRLAGFHPQNEALVLPWSRSDAALSQSFFAHRDRGPLRVVLSPTHRRSVRRWSLDSYAQLAKWLGESWGAQIYWIWGPGEESVIDDVMARCPIETIKAPPTQFREMAALIANCDLFIGNSNGPSHVAVAVGTPSLQLHGPTLAASWCPCSQTHRALQAGDGSIESIDLGQVQSSLEEMRPEIESHHRRRRQIGFTSESTDAGESF